MPYPFLLWPLSYIAVGAVVSALTAIVINREGDNYEFGDDYRRVDGEDQMYATMGVFFWPLVLFFGTIYFVVIAIGRIGKLPFVIARFMTQPGKTFGGLTGRLRKRRAIINSYFSGRPSITATPASAVDFADPTVHEGEVMYDPAV